MSGSIAFADQEETRQKHDDREQPAAETKSQSSAAGDRFKTRLTVGGAEGYDNNAFLDSSRKGDIFDQTLADFVVKYKAIDNLNIKIAYGFSSITYHEKTTLSMLDNDVAASLEYYIGKNIKAEAGYDIEFIHYINNDEADFHTDGPFASMRFYFSPESYMGGKYQYKVYDYDEQKIRLGGNREVSTTREDCRHIIIGEAATSVENLSLKVKNTFNVNDSNNEYMDFYDYWSNKVMGYITYKIDEKAFILLNGGYQRKEYESRQITISDSKQEDDLMILGGGVYYELMPKLYFNASYTYRQNYSNDPFQEYSGSVSTAGINYFF